MIYLKVIVAVILVGVVGVVTTLLWTSINNCD